MAITASQMRWFVGTTARNSPDPDPVRHVFTLRSASRWGRNHRALCGASILPYPGGQLVRGNEPPPHFDPDHPRACRRCKAAL